MNHRLDDLDETAYRPERVVELLRELDRRTGGPGGSRRLAWTPEWLEARAWFREALVGLPVTVDTDEAGNLWAVLPGARPETVVVGSHLDSVPSGGWLDGALGVMAGVELLRSLAAAGTPPACTVALVDWADEEGARFSRSLFGSAAAMGTLDLDVLRTLRDRTGEALPDVLAAHGVRLDDLDACRARLADVRAYVEVHIEQGPVLEERGLGIGVVTGTVGIERERLVLTGQAAHAGTTPMRLRRDSFAAASRFALAVADVARAHDGVATVGWVECRPGVVTAVPGETRLTLDLRHIDPDALAAMLDGARAAAAEAAAAERCEAVWEPIWRIPPMPFHRALIEAAADAVEAVEGHRFALPSGALHDASEMARGIPTAMVFSSSTNGLSHTKEEDTPVEHLAMAVDAFHRTVSRAIDLVAAGDL